MSNINISDKNTGDQHTAAEFNTVKNFINSPIAALGALDPANIAFEANGFYNNYTQAGAIVFNVPGSVVDGIMQIINFVSDGVNTISFNSSKFDIQAGLFGFSNGDILDAGLWKIFLFSENGKINVSIPADNAADVVGPTITSGTFAADNTYIDIVFNEGVYGADDGATPAALADFAISFIQGAGAATAWTASSAKQNDNTVEGSASALVGGETTIRIFGAATGTPDGNETLEVTPADSASLYDVSGNAMLSSETTGAVSLNDQSTGAAEDVIWQDNLGCIINGNSVQSDGIQVNGRAYSNQAIPNGSDGYFEFTLGNPGGANITPIGIDIYTVLGSGAYQAFEFAVLAPTAGGAKNAAIYQGAIEDSDIGTYNAGAKMRINIISGVVTIEEWNGATWDVRHTFASAQAANMAGKFGSHSSPSTAKQANSCKIQAAAGLVYR